MQINAEKSGVVSGVGQDKLRIAIDGPTRSDVDNTATRELAQKEAAARGFSNGGLCEVPQTFPVGFDGEPLAEDEALNPNAEIACYRTEFTYAQKI